uniref:Rho termination factor N-terminal domain-containing protein n=1 Tax=viral metagenome TaxID=1070528 RepID=A0A6C0AJE9_9ZZZZ
MESLSLVELKQLAKQRRIKQYYILKRSQLIQLLSLAELPKSFIIEKMTISQLREEAKRKGVRGFWTLRREQLVELLFPSENLSDHMNKV